MRATGSGASLMSVGATKMRSASPIPADPDRALLQSRARTTSVPALPPEARPKREGSGPLAWSHIGRDRGCCPPALNREALIVRCVAQKGLTRRTFRPPSPGLSRLAAGGLSLAHRLDNGSIPQSWGFAQVSTFGFGQPAGGSTSRQESRDGKRSDGGSHTAGLRSWPQLLTEA